MPVNIKLPKISRLENKESTLPMFTSCCPGWVKFAEFYYPEMIPHLTTARSPQIHSGGAYKTWWAEKEGIDPKNIVVVSFMPCTSKKYEAGHEKLKVNDMYPVDYVLTTRETGVLLKIGSGIGNTFLNVLLKVLAISRVSSMCGN